MGLPPHLDGLRALAVYLVVLFHAGVDRLAGGFIGVDVFFVLSGFLVTGILLRKLDVDGRVSLRRFYARRARRLLPAALVVLTATAVLFSVVSSPIDGPDLTASIRAAALYVANWRFIVEATDYFGSDIAADPVLHFWSLAVEEQFYLAWPLLLLGLHRLARPAGAHRRTVVRGVVAVAALASAAAALLVARTDGTRAYYGTDTRAYQLLAGALIALTPGLARRLGRSPAVRRLAGPVSVGVLALLVTLATSLVAVGPITRGVAACLVVVVLLVAFEVGPGSGRRALSVAPVVYLGRISYGTYLWHWIVVVALDRTVEVAPATTVVIVGAVSTGLAAVSHRLLEQPVRTWRLLDHHRTLVIGAGLTASALVAVAVAVLPTVAARSDAEVSTGTSPVEANLLTTRTPLPPDFDREAASQDRQRPRECNPERIQACVDTPGTGPRVLLVGDSHAAMYLALWRQLAQDLGFELAIANVGRCPWVRGVFLEGERTRCLAGQDTWFERTIPTYDPDVVVLAHLPLDDPNRPVEVVDRDAGAVGPEGLGEVFAERVPETLGGLTEDGRDVVVIEPVPLAPDGFQPLGCLAGATVVEDCGFLAGPGPGPEEVAIAGVAAADDRVWSLDLDDLVCPDLPVCLSIVDGVAVRWDVTHLTGTFARSLAPAVAEWLRAEGVPLGG